jgi:hypothetical protein
MDVLADIDVTAIDRQLGGLEGADADDSALDVCTLDVDLRRSYRRALVARDEAAAFLVTREGWSYSDAAQATCGHRAHAERMHVVVDWTRSPDFLEQPAAMLRRYQTVADGLRRLITRTHALAVRALPAARIEHYMPSDPLERLAYCAQWLRYTDTYGSSLVASRNLYGAILVQHHHWALQDVAGIARTDTDQIAVASTAAAHNPPSDADSGMLRELTAVADAVSHNALRLMQAGREAVQRCIESGVPRPVIEAYGGPLATA